MAELTALLGSGGDLEKIASARPIATSLAPAASAIDEDRLGVKRGGMTKDDETFESQDAKKKANSSAVKDDSILQPFDEVILARRAAREYRSWMLEQINVNINATLNYAIRLAGASLSPDLAAQPTDRQGKQDKSNSTPKLERLVPAAAEAAEYRTKAFEFMTDNVNATLEYSRQLADVRSPAEFVEVSTNHARKQLELIMKHTIALGALSRSLMMTNAEWITGIVY